MFDTKILTDNGVNLEKSLELFGDMATYNDNLDEFLDDVENKLNSIKQYKESADMPNYAILVHSLKSDAKYFGFEKLAELSLNHEMKSKESDINYVNEHYDELINEANRIINIVKEYMGLEYEKQVIEKQTHNNEYAILVVDDSNVISNFVMKIFNNEYDVIVANDGQVAIDKLSTMTDRIAGMLLDLNMPNVNGYDVLKFMKTNNIFDKINVAIITGTDSNTVLKQVEGYPVKAILEKPFNETNIKRVLDLIVRK